LAGVAQVIDTLGGVQVVIGHTFGTFLAKITAFNYMENVPAIITAAGAQVPPYIAYIPFIVGNTSFPMATRLDALGMALFFPNHDPHMG
jgi:pimeloyl-ACP methyl ester carboxylesterase